MEDVECKHEFKEKKEKNVKFPNVEKGPVHGFKKLMIVGKKVF